MLSTCSFTSGRVSKARTIAPSALRGADRGEARDAGADHQHLGRRNLARRRDLAGEEAAEVLRGLDDGTIAGDVRHRAQRIDLLGARDARHAVHRHDRGTGLRQPCEECRVLCRPQEGNECLVCAQAAGLTAFRCTDLEDEVGIGPYLAGADDFAARGAVGLVGVARGLAGAGFDRHGIAQLLQFLCNVRRCRNALFPRINLFRNTDLHYCPSGTRGVLYPNCAGFAWRQLQCADDRT